MAVGCPFTISPAFCLQQWAASIEPALHLKKKHEVCRWGRIATWVLGAVGSHWLYLHLVTRYLEKQTESESQSRQSFKLILKSWFDHESNAFLLARIPLWQARRRSVRWASHLAQSDSEVPWSTAGLCNDEVRKFVERTAQGETALRMLKKYDKDTESLRPFSHWLSALRLAPWVVSAVFVWRLLRLRQKHKGTKILMVLWCRMEGLLICVLCKPLLLPNLPNSTKTVFVSCVHARHFELGPLWHRLYELIYVAVCLHLTHRSPYKMGMVFHMSYLMRCDACPEAWRGCAHSLHESWRGLRLRRCPTSASRRGISWRIN